MYGQTLGGPPPGSSVQSGEHVKSVGRNKIEEISPHTSTETDTGSVYRTAEGSVNEKELNILKYDERRGSWNDGSSSIMVDQVLYSADYSAAENEASKWKDDNFDFEYRPPSMMNQPENILSFTAPSNKELLMSSPGSRRTSASSIVMGNNPTAGIHEGGGVSSIENSDNMSYINHFDKMNLNFQNASLSNMNTKQYAKPERKSAPKGNNYLQQDKPLRPAQQQPQSIPPNQIQNMIAMGQAQYVMIPGVGLTLVPVMQMSPPQQVPFVPQPSYHHTQHHQQHHQHQQQAMLPSPFAPLPMQNSFNMSGGGGASQFMPAPSKTTYKATASALAAMALQSADGQVYLIHFKHSHRNFILSHSAPRNIRLGEFVIVEADRGEDIGIVVEVVPAYTFSDDKHTAGHRGKGFATDQHGEIRKITRIASADERELLPAKAAEESSIAEVCREKVMYQFMMPITVIDTEFQVDRHKLTIYYEAQKRIDFRDLVRDLFALYKTRIWMAQIDSSFEPNLDASVALVSGQYPTMYSMNMNHMDATAAVSNGSSALNPNANRYVAPPSGPLTSSPRRESFSSTTAPSWQPYDHSQNY